MRRFCGDEILVFFVWMEVKRKHVALAVCVGHTDCQFVVMSMCSELPLDTNEHFCMHW